MKQNFEGCAAFTLIELLIVVLIITILAAIALPNFLEFQTRAKVSRVKSDLRTIAIAVEAYAVDFGTYPRDGNGTPYAGLLDLTTPIRYISARFTDVLNNGFKDGRSGSPVDVDRNIEKFYELGTGNDNGNQWPANDWALASYGPDQDDDTHILGRYPLTNEATPYDPTNGTVSNGDIYRMRNIRVNFITDMNPETF